MIEKKQNKKRVKKGGDEVMTFNTSGDHEVDMALFGWKLSRRQLMQQAGLAGLLLAFPWAESAFAAVPPLPKVPFTKNKTNDGIVGPYGEARIFNVGGEALPAFVSAFDGSAVIDCTGRSPFVRFGASTDLTAIILTSAGVQFGAAKPVPWDAAAVKQLIAAVVADRKKARGAMLLRSALHTSYPVAVAQTKSKMGKGMANAMSKGAAGYGVSAFKCVTTTITDTVTKTITDVVNVWKTAEKQYQECYDREIAKDPCKSAPFGTAGVCAAGICAAQAFVDIVVGTATVVTTVVEEVTRQVVTCVLPKPGIWPNPWNLLDKALPGAVPQKKAAFTQKDIDAAIKLLKDIGAKIGGFLGPFTCLLDGKWSLAQLDTQLNFGAGNIVIPYGVKVCITATCATSLIDGSMITAAVTAWGTTLGVLAALSTDIAALGIPALPGAAALVAALGGAATAGVAASPGVAAAAIILALILLLMIYATAIFGQLLYQKNFTNNFADGQICIEHPTFALALIKLFTMGIAPAELIPPIVTG